MKKDLTKFNTALDLMLLTPNQVIELGELTKNDRLTYTFNISDLFPYLVYSKPCNMVDPDGSMPYRYGCNRHFDGFKLVDYATFKEIHFSNFKLEKTSIENEKVADELIDKMRKSCEKCNKPKREFDVIRLFWKVGIVVLIIIGINHLFGIYSNVVAIKQLDLLNQKDSINTSYYNDGVRIGWKSGLLKCSETFVAKGYDFTIPLDLSKDSTAYKSLLWKSK